MGAWVRYVLIFIGVFLPFAANSQPEKDWVEVNDPREFVPECSLEDAVEMSFAEVAENYADLIGKCVKVGGYYSAAFYDGVEGFVKSNGDFWTGVSDEVLARNRMGVYFIEDHDPYYLEEPADEVQEAAQEVYWKKHKGAENFQLKNVTLTATIFSCEGWLKNEKLKHKGKITKPIGYCHHATGSFLVVYFWQIEEDQRYDPVLNLPTRFFGEDQEFANQNSFNRNHCTWENSEQVDFLDLTFRPAEYFGKCVKVRGLTDGVRTYYSDVRGQYKNAQISYPDFSPYRMGLYYLDTVLGEETEKWYKNKFYSEVIGLVGTCFQKGNQIWLNIERFEQWEEFLSGKPKEEQEVRIIMMGGFCHYFSETFLEVADTREIQKGIKRLTGKKNRREFGNLKIETDFLGAEELKNFIFDWVEIEIGKSQAKPENPKTSPLARYKSLGVSVSENLPMTAFLLEEQDPDNPESINGNLCICLEKDCSAVWPISTVDLIYKSYLPYMCIYFQKEKDLKNPESVNIRRQWQE